jgi:hypothetical protein
VVVLNQVVERQTQNVFVEMPRFFSITGSVCVVVQALYLGWRGQSGVISHGWHFQSMGSIEISSYPGV